MEPRPSEPKVAEPEAPLLLLDLAGAATRDAPPDALRADRRPPPPLPPAEEATESPPPENPELLPPPPDAAPDVLASEVPAEATELPEPVEEPLRLPPDLSLPPLETVTVAIPPRLDIWTDVPLDDPPRPPRSEGAINEMYFSAAVTPVRRSVLAIGPDSAGAVRTATTLACVNFCWRCVHVQYPAAPAATRTIPHIHAFELFLGSSGGTTTCGPGPAGLCGVG